MTVAALDLVYFADPMCSWCYGFGPEFEKVIEQESAIRTVKLDLIMGGLRAYNKAVMDAESKNVVHEHWIQVAERSGLPFDGTAMDADSFVFDTEPACRAVVTARRLDASRALDMLRAIQRAFYGHGFDTTKTDVLAAIARDCGFDGKAFDKAFRSLEMKHATREDFTLTQKVGVNGFPTLCVDGGEKLLLITAGFAKAERVLEGLARLAAPSPPLH